MTFWASGFENGALSQGLKFVTLNSVKLLSVFTLLFFLAPLCARAVSPSEEVLNERRQRLEQQRQQRRRQWLEEQRQKVSPEPVILEKKPAPRENMVWNASLGYSLRTDLADTSSPRLYTHSLDFNGGFDYKKDLSFFAGLMLSYESIGEKNSEIVVDSENTELFLSNISLGGQRRFSLWEIYKLSLSLENEFPTSADAQREGYGSITSLGFSLSRGFSQDRISLIFSGGVFKIWNSYKYSPSSGMLNNDSGARLQLALRCKLWRELVLSASVGGQASRYTDGTQDQLYKNSVGAAYSWGAWSAFANLTNGSYLDNSSEATFWFIDEYRRVVSAGGAYQW
jgi:hypothetical protein